MKFRKISHRIPKIGVLVEMDDMGECLNSSQLVEEKEEKEEKKEMTPDLQLGLIGEEDETIDDVPGSIDSPYLEMTCNIEEIYFSKQREVIGSIHCILDFPETKKDAERLIEMIWWMFGSIDEPWMFWAVACCKFSVHEWDTGVSNGKYTIVMCVKKKESLMCIHGIDTRVCANDATSSPWPEGLDISSSDDGDCSELPDGMCIMGGELCVKLSISASLEITSKGQKDGENDGEKDSNGVYWFPLRKWM